MKIKTANIQCTKNGKTNSLRIQYTSVSVKVRQSLAKTKPSHYWVELRGCDVTAKIFASTPTTTKRLKELLTQKQINPLIGANIVLGKDAIRVHVIHPPTGWPTKSNGRVEVLANAGKGGMMPEPENPQPPTHKEPGIQIMDYTINQPDIFIPYSRLKEVAVDAKGKRFVVARFRDSNSSQDPVFLMLLLMNAKNAAKLRTQIQKRIPVRLTINKHLGGMQIGMGDLNWVLLGIFRFLYSPTTTAKFFNIKIPPFIPHKMVRNAAELTK